jgi:glycosyltransferase involved in cell wall biosynthesis
MTHNTNNCDIAWIETGGARFGGQIYNEKAREILSEICPTELLSIQPIILRRTGILKYFEIIIKLLRLSGKKNIWIRDFFSVLTMDLDRTEGRTIAMIHHDDFSGYSPHKRLILEALRKRFHANLRKCDGIVTVSKFWRNYFLERGFKNVHTVYNCFDLNEFNARKNEVDAFKEKYALTDKPIVYIGNCQRAKGVVESYEALKELDVHLVSSGIKMVKIPAKNYIFSRQDYIKLLKASSVVVTMSKFDEGWCRTAHEAILCGTPVIGSGRGGMRELLENGEQIVCENFADLKKNVKYLLDNPAKTKEIGAKGFAFAAGFNIEKFKMEWRKVMSQLQNHFFP